MMVTLIVSEQSLARDTHTRTHTDRQTDKQTRVFNVKMCKVVSGFANKNVPEVVFSIESPSHPF